MSLKFPRGPSFGSTREHVANFCWHRNWSVIVFVVSLLLGTLWFLKSRNLGNLGTLNKSVAILETSRIDTKHKLLVIKYAGRRLLLGVSPNQITLLDNQPESEMPEHSGVETPISSSFRQQLQSLVTKD